MNSLQSCLAALAAARRRPRFAAVALIVMLVIGGAVMNAAAQSYTVDQSTSQALTSYLREHHLPLVGASVAKAGDGSTRVMLYGYVATQQGKRNAAARAATYFKNDPRIALVNRITVNPEIRDLGSSSAAAAAPESGGYSAPAASSSSGALTWDQVYREIQQGGIHPAPDPGGGSSSAW